MSENISTRKAEPGHGGLGLGVFIAITLMERLGGAVTFDNAPGAGARVSLSLSRKSIEAGPLSGAGQRQDAHRVEANPSP
jgi:two-component system sensor histidine kinase RegB